MTKRISDYLAHQMRSNSLKPSSFEQIIHLFCLKQALLSSQNNQNTKKWRYITENTCFKLEISLNNVMGNFNIVCLLSKLSVIS